MAEWIDTLAARLDDRAARGTRVAQPPGEEAAQAPHRGILSRPERFVLLRADVDDR